MATLQVRDVDNLLYESLKKLAANEKGSLGQEVIHITETFMANPLLRGLDYTDEFLQLSDSWEVVTDST